MTKTKLRKSFLKDYKKLQTWQKKACTDALEIFDVDPYHPKLRRHKTKGKYLGLESIDVTPDLRALFYHEGEFYVFYYIKNHGQLYD